MLNYLANFTCDFVLLPEWCIKSFLALIIQKIIFAHVAFGLLFFSMYTKNKVKNFVWSSSYILALLFNVKKTRGRNVSCLIVTVHQYSPMQIPNSCRFFFSYVANPMFLLFMREVCVCVYLGRAQKVAIARKKHNARRRVLVIEQRLAPRHATDWDESGRIGTDWWWRLVVLVFIAPQPRVLISKHISGD